MKPNQQNWNVGYVISAFRNFVRYSSEFGIFGALQIFIRNKGTNNIKKINLKKYKYPLLYRTGTTDFPILRIIIGREMVFQNLTNPALIIDAGANVGYVSVFYANRYPQSEVISIEMEESNFKLLQKNTNAYKNIKSINAALWNHNLGVSFGKSGSNDSYNLIDQSANCYHISSVTIDNLIDQGFKADLIKLDIEGAEVEVLEDMRQKNIQPSVLVVELHERFRKGCNQALERYLDGRRYKREKIYEYEVVVFD